MKIVPNRKSETILDVLKEFVVPGTIIRTDCHPSYPDAVLKFGSIHEKINHSKGFKNKNNQTTNPIESMWSNFKSMYRKRHGLLKSRLGNFVQEYIWRRRNCVARSKDETWEA